MRVKYGTGLDTFARAVMARQIYTSGDPSQDALIALALVYTAMQRLADSGIDITFNGSPLVIPSIERAYREALYIRKEITEDWLDTSFITKFGRLQDAEGEV